MGDADHSLPITHHLSLKWSGLPVVSVDYKCDGEFSEDRIRSSDNVIRAGSVYSRSGIRKSIEYIYSLGGFSDIEVDAQSAENGVVLTFILTKQIRVRNVDLVGNKSLEADEITRAMKLKKGREYDNSIVRMDVEAMLELYKFHGFFNADIQPVPSVDDRSKQADITFKISEGGRPTVEKIILIGTIENRPEDEAAIRTRNLLKSMKQVKRGDSYRGQQALDSDVRLIEDLYGDSGYITAKVKEAKALSDQDTIKSYDGKGKHFPAENIQKSDLKDGTVVIVIEIEQGRKVHIDIEGNEHIRDNDIKKAVAIRRMRSVSKSVLRKSEEDIENLYIAKGYYLVDVEHQVLEDKVWDFNTDGDARGWEAFNESASLAVSGNGLRVSSSDDALQIQSSEVRIKTDIYKRFQIRMRTDKSSVGWLYWTTDGSREWYKKQFDVIPDNHFHSYEMDMREHKKWSNTVIRLRISLVLETQHAIPLPAADVDIASIKLITESIPIVFKVKEGRLMRIEEISIVASEGEDLQVDEEEIKKQMLTRKKSHLSFWPLKRYFSDGILDKATFQIDLRAIIAFYKYKGYPNARIIGSKVNTEKGSIEITVIISEGPRTYVTEVVLEGDHEDISDIREVLSHLAALHGLDPDFQTSGHQAFLLSGRGTFREDDIVAARSYLRTWYADRGYLYAQIEASKEFSNDNSQAVITYRVDAGKKIKIGDIEIWGNTRTRRRVIERELSDRLRKDRVFSYTETAKSWQRLLDLGFFESVKIDTKPIVGSEDLVKMTIDVKEKKAISMNMHIGFGSPEEFRVGTELTHANLWGTGRRVRANAQIGTEGASGELNYAEPRLPIIKSLGLVDLYRQPRRDEDYTETRTGVAAGISRTLHRLNTLTCRYRYEVVNYQEDKDEKTAKMGKIETTFQREGRKNPLNPREGWFHSLTLEYANPRLGGTETFAKFTMNNMHYRPLSQNIVLALGARTGYAQEMPTPEQFSLRDYRTPRGYRWEAEDTGTMMLNVSMEIRFPIYKWFGAAVFFDSGGVCDEASDLIRSMSSSIGIGLRFITPIGPARLDYGYPIRGDGNRNYWPQVALGHAF